MQKQTTKQKIERVKAKRAMRRFIRRYMFAVWLLLGFVLGNEYLIYSTQRAIAQLPVQAERIIYLVPNDGSQDTASSSESEVILSEVEQAIGRHSDTLKSIGSMGEAMIVASEEFDIDIGWLLGIASAESSLGKKFVYAYDKDNCHNWWGIKPPGGRRADGSYLRCYDSDLAGARSIAKLLKTRYIGQGLNTPDKVVKVYVGQKWSEYHGHWVANVKKYLG